MHRDMGVPTTQCKETSLCTPRTQLRLQKSQRWGFPGGAVVEHLPANAGDTGSSPGLGRSHMPRSD